MHDAFSGRCSKQQPLNRYLQVEDLAALVNVCPVCRWRCLHGSNPKSSGLSVATINLCKKKEIMEKFLLDLTENSRT